MKKAKEQTRVENTEVNAEFDGSTKYPQYVSSITLMKIMDVDADYLMSGGEDKASSITHKHQKMIL